MRYEPVELPGRGRSSVAAPENELESRVLFELIRYKVEERTGDFAAVARGWRLNPELRFPTSPGRDPLAPWLAVRVCATPAVAREFTDSLDWVTNDETSWRDCEVALEARPPVETASGVSAATPSLLWREGPGSPAGYEPDCAAPARPPAGVTP